MCCHGNGSTYLLPFLCIIITDTYATSYQNPQHYYWQLLATANTEITTAHIGGWWWQLESGHKKTLMAGLTLALEGSGSLAKPHQVHTLLYLWSGSNWGCRMSDNERWEVLQQTSSLCIRYIWSWYLTSETHYQTLCLSLLVSEVEDNSLCGHCHCHWWF